MTAYGYTWDLYSIRETVNHLQLRYKTEGCIRTETGIVFWLVLPCVPLCHCLCNMEKCLTEKTRRTLSQSRKREWTKERSREKKSLPKQNQMEGVGALFDLLYSAWLMLHISFPCQGCDIMFRPLFSLFYSLSLFSLQWSTHQTMKRHQNCDHQNQKCWKRQLDWK